MGTHHPGSFVVAARRRLFIDLTQITRAFWLSMFAERMLEGVAAELKIGGFARAPSASERDGFNKKNGSR